MRYKPSGKPLLVYGILLIAALLLKSIELIEPPTTAIGTFVDAPVYGLSYWTSTQAPYITECVGS